MRNFILFLVNFLWITNVSAADDGIVSQNTLFDDADIIVRAAPTQPSADIPDNKSKIKAIEEAKAMLRQTPRRLTIKGIPAATSDSQPHKQTHKRAVSAAPFGLFWNSSIASTREQGIKLNLIDIKDYPNSYEAFDLPKSINFFERIFITYGLSDQLYRIIAYSKPIEDDASASKILGHYHTYSEYLDKKYGNMQQQFTPALITKTIPDEKDKEKETTIEEPAPLGNSDFLSQLASGTAVLYSTYHNDEVEAVLSIGVNGDNQSYLVIEYRNLNLLKQFENKTIDAL